MSNTTNDTSRAKQYEITTQQPKELEVDEYPSNSVKNKVNSAAKPSGRHRREPTSSSDPRNCFLNCISAVFCCTCLGLCCDSDSGGCDCDVCDCDC